MTALIGCLPFAPSLAADGTATEAPAVKIGIIACTGDRFELEYDDRSSRADAERLEHWPEIGIESRLEESALRQLEASSGLKALILAPETRPLLRPMFRNSSEFLSPDPRRVSAELSALAQAHALDQILLITRNKKSYGLGHAHSGAGMHWWLYTLNGSHGNSGTAYYAHAHVHFTLYLVAPESAKVIAKRRLDVDADFARGPYSAMPIEWHAPLESYSAVLKARIPEAIQDALAEGMADAVPSLISRYERYRSRKVRGDTS